MEFLDGIPLGREIAEALGAVGALVVAILAYRKGLATDPNAPKGGPK